MARILDIMSHYPTPASPQIIGGAQVSRVLFHKVLSAHGHETTVIRGREKNHPMPDEKAGASGVIPIPFTSRYSPALLPTKSVPSRVLWHLEDDFNVDIQPQIHALIDQVRPDVFMTGILGGLSSAVWRAARDRNLPVVHYIHDYYLMCHRSTRHRKARICKSVCPTCTLTTRKRRRASVYRALDR